MHHERNITCKVLWSYQQLHVDIYIYKLCSLWFDPMGARTHDLPHYEIIHTDKIRDIAHIKFGM
jgi:hypothetical protein